jgi:hypothetical protein
MPPRDTGDLLRSTMNDLGVPSSVDKRVRSFRSSLSAMMGEELPRQLVDLDTHLLRALEMADDQEPTRLADRLGDALDEWDSTGREDLYGLSPEDLRESLIKLEDLSFRDGVRVALEDPNVITSMFVLLKSGNLDYRKGAIFTLEEVVKKDPRALDIKFLQGLFQGPYSKEERVMLIENATEFGRMIGRMILKQGTRAQGLELVERLATSGEDTQVRVAMKTFTHLSKVSPEEVDVELLTLGAQHDNDFNRETAARVVQNLVKHVSDRVPDQVLETMARDRTWTVRQVAVQALGNLWTNEPDRAENLVSRLVSDKDENAVKVAERAQAQIEKKAKKSSKSTPAAQ